MDRNIGGNYMGENISGAYWSYVQSKAEEGVKLYQRIYSWLNQDLLNGILLKDNCFWVEPCSYPNKLPKYIHKNIVKWGKSKGYIYWLDIPVPVQ